MTSRSISLIVFGVLVLTSTINGAAIDNEVAEPRIRNSEELISKIVDQCFHANAMHCLKEQVLTYLNTVAGLQGTTVSGRALSDELIDKEISDRVARILNTNEFRLQLPETFFGSSVMSYRVDRGFDLELPKNEARRDKSKDKMLLPLLLLMKLKLKIILPILMGLIGLKAFKALILSKIAIKLVLGFLIYNLIQKLGGMKMSMTPALPQSLPPTEYGVPTSAPYDSSSWESPNSGGPYARWDSQNIAYSAYHPSNSYSSSSNGGSSSGSSSSSSYSSS